MKVNYLRGEHTLPGERRRKREPASSSLASRMNYSATFTSAFENMEKRLNVRGGLNIHECTRAELSERVIFVLKC